jgi:hypothetical protein
VRQKWRKFCGVIMGKFVQCCKGTLQDLMLVMGATGNLYTTAPGFLKIKIEGSMGQMAQSGNVIPLP